MNPILDILMNAAGGGAVQKVAQRFGLSEEQAGSAMNQLVPALMGGLQRNTAQAGGMDALLGALNGGNHAQYLERPELLDQDATTEDGNSILGHILGSKDASRAVASQAAEQTGIGTDVLKKMLPVVATMVMGGLSKQNAAVPSAGLGGGAASLISSLLNPGQGETASEGVSGLLGRFLGGR